MTGVGHLLTGGAVTTAVLVTMGVRDARQFLPSLAVALFAALLPDIDGRSSLLQGWLKGSGGHVACVVAGLLPRSTLRASLLRAGLAGGESVLRIFVSILLWLIHRVVRHRGVLHSLVALCAGTAVVAKVAQSQTWSPLIPLAFASGYATHILADMTTQRGVRLFWPVSRRFWHLLPRPWRICPQRTLTLGELQIALFFAGASFSLAHMPPPQFLCVFAFLVAFLMLITIWDERRRQQKAKGLKR